LSVVLDRERRMVRAVSPVMLAVAWLSAPGMASGQNPCFDGSTEIETGCTIDAPRWIAEFATLSANGVIGGLTAGLVRHFRGGSFGDGFVSGLLGGATTYAGKRVAAERFSGAGAIGRIVSAGGASMVRNATSGELLLSRLTVPVGPVWVELRRTGAGTSLGARIDPVALGWLVYALAEPELVLDAAESLSAGAAVFRTRGKVLSFGDDDRHAAGVTNAGVIFLAGVPAYGRSFERRALAHERVHVLQEDALAIMWTDPLATRAFRGLGEYSPSRYVAVNLSTELLRTLAGFGSRHEDRPWEMESIFLAR
jgi:hypothetical protein